MTPTLRKIHRYTWFAFALLLPLGWLAAIWVLPETVWQKPVRPGQPAPLPRLLQTKESRDFVFNLRQDSTLWFKQIEIFIKKPLINPNTAVIITFGAPSENPKERLLGLLGSQGVWRFNLDSLAARSPQLSLRLEDKIQRKTLKTIVFEQ